MEKIYANATIITATRSSQIAEETFVVTMYTFTLDKVEQGPYNLM